MKKILLVEDDAFLSDILSEKLRKEGFDIDFATDGIEAVKKIEEISPSLVLLDIILPSIDGLEVLKRIRSHENRVIQDLPVIMLSNLGQKEDSKKAFALGANEYLVKANFTTEEIIEKINKQLNLQ